MPTVVTKSIGSAGGRDYSTIATWFDAIPDDIVAVDEEHVGQCYNDSEFSSASNLVTFSGVTVNSSHDITLECGPGQSFRDHANKLTNPLRYDQSKGVGLKCTSAGTATVVVSQNFVILRGLQIINTADGPAIDNNQAAIAGAEVAYCLCESSEDSEFTAAVRWRSGVIHNTLVIARNSAAGSGVSFSFPGSLNVYNVTVVRPSDLTAAHHAFYADSGTVTLVNCAGFGFTNFVNNSSHFGSSSSNNASDNTIGFGTSNQASLTYTSQFESTTSSGDFKLKTGSALIDAGTASIGTVDIVGTTRPAGDEDIGAWELASADASRDDAKLVFRAAV